MCVAYVALLIVILPSGISQCIAQKPPAENVRVLQSMQAAFSSDVAKLKERLFADLPAVEKRIYDQIKFHVPLSDAPDLAVARIEQGTLLVELGVGFIRGLTMMIDSLAIEIYWNRPGLTLQ